MIDSFDCASLAAWEALQSVRGSGTLSNLVDLKTLRENYFCEFYEKHLLVSYLSFKAEMRGIRVQFSLSDWRFQCLSIRKFRAFRSETFRTTRTAKNCSKTKFVLQSSQCKQFAPNLISLTQLTSKLVGLAEPIREAPFLYWLWRSKKVLLKKKVLVKTVYTSDCERCKGTSS